MKSGRVNDHSINYKPRLAQNWIKESAGSKFTGVKAIAKTQKFSSAI